MARGLGDVSACVALCVSIITGFFGQTCDSAQLAYNEPRVFRILLFSDQEKRFLLVAVWWMSCKLSRNQVLTIAHLLEFDPYFATG